MRYICLVYHEESRLNEMSEAELAEHIAKCSAWVKELTRSGRHIFSAGLQSIQTAATVRLRNGRVCVTDGPFAETKEQLGGFTVLEARDLNEAIQAAALLDVVRIGTIEVRPLADPDLELGSALDRRLWRR